MRASSMGSMMVGAMIGVGAATAFGMMNRQTQRKLKKIVCNTGRQVADGFNSLMS